MSFNKVVTVISVALSVFAVFISLYANNISEKAYQLSLNSYNSERVIVLKMEKVKSKISLIPVSKDSLLHSVIIKLPNDFDMKSISLGSPNFTLDDDVFSAFVTEHISTFNLSENGVIKTLNNFSIPALFSISGYIKGNSKFQVSYYDLIFKVIITPEKTDVELKAIVIKEPQVSTTDFSRYIEDVFIENTKVFEDANNLNHKTDS
ncbi:MULTISPECIES: hypothetical protein [Aliivibrio]|uniref:Uncharacterized protein n=1 Tax=Aliivibrio finisterrensis TaxID=511998 RepID=A0A4Q5KLY6_9GAMM|nr:MULTISPECIES: hypothetical protein [Aliivibrio]MDD9180635.1 hypothetical protein [Aliivibrio sp. A6]RYU47438.1 hypothetical protein ERW57_18565 [Aliivibrio finisterrensis]RYU48288.1 hypothetical protein ERW56_18730 [Aliivibrio finisterrensis]RYU53035.1 hypothetical protein ERW50_18860 [Aliivibrio finisterrensis]RYU78803.1 hypothetical protein ERW55_18855 [Aliivibrio finisterrensis]